VLDFCLLNKKRISHTFPQFPKISHYFSTFAHKVAFLKEFGVIFFVLDNAKIIKTIVNKRVLAIVGESGIKISKIASFLINVEYLILKCSQNEKIHPIVHNLDLDNGDNSSPKKRDLEH